MNKNLIAIVVVAGFTTPVAAIAADAKVFGRIQAAYTSLSVDNSKTADFTKIEDDYGMSRVGFTISEDVGYGLTMIGTLEWKFDPAQIDGTFDEREQYIGLKGGFGELRLGINTSPYKTAGGVKLDPWTATAMEGRSTAKGINTKGGLSRADLTGLGQSGHVPQTITYYSPEVNNFSGAIMLHVNGGDLSDSTTATGAALADALADYKSQERNNTYSVAVNWKNNNLWVFAAQSSDQCNSLTTTVSAGTTTASCKDASLTKLGAQWKMGPHKVGAQYEMDSGGASTAVSDQTRTLGFGT